MQLKPSLLLAIFAWINFFAFAWLLMLRVIPADWQSGFWAFVMFIVAAMASAVYRTIGGNLK